MIEQPEFIKTLLDKRKDISKEIEQIDIVLNMYKEDTVTKTKSGELDPKFPFEKNMSQRLLHVLSTRKEWMTSSEIRDTYMKLSGENAPKIFSSLILSLVKSKKIDVDKTLVRKYKYRISNL